MQRYFVAKLASGGWMKLKKNRRVTGSNNTIKHVTEKSLVLDFTPDHVRGPTIFFCESDIFGPNRDAGGRADLQPGEPPGVQDTNRCPDHDASPGALLEFDNFTIPECRYRQSRKAHLEGNEAMPYRTDDLFLTGTGRSR